jgi:tetratricopeptide (TPR) repeat protein
MRRRASSVVAGLLGLALAAAPLAAQGSTGADDKNAALMRALDFEQAGKVPEAIAAYREAAAGLTLQAAVLGLERLYMQVGRTDSLLALLDRVLRERPGDPSARAAQLRTLLSLGKREEAAQGFERWIAAAPGDPQPWREYARQLLDANRTAAADSVLARAQRVLGGGREVAAELAQLRAMLGLWGPSAEAWRTALKDATWLLQAAVFALQPAPTAERAGVQRALRQLPVEPGARRASAFLSLAWGQPRDGWTALRDLPPGDSTMAAWLEFADQAEGLGQFDVAREAMVYALGVKSSPAVALRAANASLLAGDAAGALKLAGEAEGGLDSTQVAQRVLPIRVRALAALGRPQAAESLVTAYARRLDPPLARRLSGAIARGWVKVGDLARAQAALDQAGADGDDDQVAGWVALYRGDLAVARRELSHAREGGGDAVSALALLSRTRTPSAPRTGTAFLALARGDTAAATGAFVEAARELPEAAPLLLSLAARLHAARKQDAAAIPLWTRVASEFASAPEASEAELEWARALARAGQGAAAIARYEHLILTWPNSALVPQARRELEALKRKGSGA